MPIRIIVRQKNGFFVSHFFSSWRRSWWSWLWVLMPFNFMKKVNA